MYLKIIFIKTSDINIDIIAPKLKEQLSKSRLFTNKILQSFKLNTIEGDLNDNTYNIDDARSNEKQIIPFVIILFPPTHPT